MLYSIDLSWYTWECLFPKKYLASTRPAKIKIPGETIYYHKGNIRRKNTEQNNDLRSRVAKTTPLRKTVSHVDSYDVQK